MKKYDCNLKEYMRNMGQVSGMLQLHMLQDVADGLNYMKKMNLVHR